jgi:transcriptional regulator with XRE-family HTH domain
VTVAERFAANLLRHRKAAGMSQEEVAALAGLHRTEIGMLERRIRLPRIDTLVKLCGALEVEPGELLEGIEWRPPQPPTGHFKTGDEDVTL